MRRAVSSAARDPEVGVPLDILRIAPRANRDEVLRAEGEGCSMVARAAPAVAEEGGGWWRRQPSRPEEPRLTGAAGRVDARRVFSEDGRRRRRGAPLRAPLRGAVGPLSAPAVAAAPALHRE